MVSINWIAIIYTVLLCILVIYAIYLLLYYSFDKNIKENNEKLAVRLKDNKIQALLNGSGINNIPNLNIITTNAAITKANDCSRGPVYIGTTGTDNDCIQTCSNASASVINVHEGEIYTYESSVLTTGAHCIIGERPQCNMNTSYAMMTINSIVCRSKYPDIVGGPLSTTVVACNNQQIVDPQNFLWDYRYNQKFNPLSTIIADTDEKLADGSFRFRCQFNGVDVRKNKYIQHPQNRFHPIRNYCASNITSAHPDVQTVFSSDLTSFTCNCGDPEITRVKNLDVNDPSSICSTFSVEIKTEVRSRQIMTLPYRCFTLFSPISDVGKYLPCPNNQLTVDGPQYSRIDIPFSLNPNVPIEHPLYKDFDSNDYELTTASGVLN